MAFRLFLPGVRSFESGSFPHLILKSLIILSSGIIIIVVLTVVKIVTLNNRELLEATLRNFEQGLVIIILSVSHLSSPPFDVFNINLIVSVIIPILICQVDTVSAPSMVVGLLLVFKSRESLNFLIF